jgi:hypothetical protein
MRSSDTEGPWWAIVMLLIFATYLVYRFLVG